MGIGDVLRELQFGTPVYRAILKIKVQREIFHQNTLGYGIAELERYGVAIRVARGLVEASVWHYTNKGNLVCGDGNNTEGLPVKEFTVIVDANLEFLNQMCPCETARVSIRKLFAVGARLSSDGQSVILGDIRD